MIETLKELNDKAIEDGLLLRDGESLRKDYSCKLGKPLSSLEDRCYRFIGELSMDGPVSTDVLIDKFYLKITNMLEVDRAPVDQLIQKIRKKMGETTIINKPGLGYLSRRTSIETKCRDAGN